MHSNSPMQSVLIVIILLVPSDPFNFILFFPDEYCDHVQHDDLKKKLVVNN